jgi:hypothetical protein
MAVKKKLPRIANTHQTRRDVGALVQVLTHDSGIFEDSPVCSLLFFYQLCLHCF